jgi:hypothetical protein
MRFFSRKDFLLVSTSNYFPLDYIFFLILAAYIFICVFYGIIKFGFNYLCLRVDRKLLIYIYLFFLKKRMILKCKFRKYGTIN